MNLENYQKVISEIDGAVEPKSPSEEKVSFDFKDSGNEGCATVFLKDGIPFEYGLYIWTGLSWKYLAEKFSEYFKMKVKIGKSGGGNGHYSGKLIIEE